MSEAWAERAAERSPSVQRSRARSVQQARLIVDAARRLVAEKGENFTTQDLIKEAGVALQTVTQFVRSVFHQQSFAATRDPAIPEDLWRLLLGALGGERT